MNYRLVFKNLGVMLLLLSGAMGVCLGSGYLILAGSLHSNETALTGWEISMGITWLCAIAFLFVGRGTSNAQMLRKDAIGLVGIGWVSCSFFAALPYIFCEPGLSFPEALFESISGLTTTGASVFNDLGSLPKTILIWRSATQWLGGMGILAMFVLVLASSGGSGKSIFRTESSMHTNEVIGTTMRQTAKRLWILYSFFTVVCGLGLLLLGMTPFQAFNHCMATVSTGGFGTENSSVSDFGTPIRIWITVFMFLCGVSFPLYLGLFRKNGWTMLKAHQETWTFAAILIFASLAIFAFRFSADNLTGTWSEDLVDTTFNTVSIATSTGFAVGDFDLWPSLAKGSLLFVMVIGGCSGSTAGGIKVSRLILLFRFLRTEIRRAFRPNLVVNHKLNGRTVPPGTRGQLLVVVVSAVAAGSIGSFLLIGFEPEISADGCISAVISSLSNTGPALAEFGPTHNFAGLTPPSMLLLSFLMILGRLEYIAVLVLLSRGLWKRY